MNSYWTNILVEIGLCGILALALNVICGMTGLLQLGHAGFYAVGAYAAGLVAIYATVPALGPLNLALGCLAAVAATAVFAVIVGLPCLRLRGDYLAIATLGFGEIVRMVLSNVQFPGCRLTAGQPFGGATGIYLPDPVYYPIGYSAGYATWPVVLVALGLTYVFMLNLKRSYIGRAMMCIREDEVAARAMGIDVPRYKMAALLISAVFAGLAGALFAHNPNSGIGIGPKDFSLLKTVEILLIVILGGLGSVTGSLLAAAAIVLLQMALFHLPAIGQFQLGEHSQLFYAAMLIVLIRLAPNGLLGLKESPAWLSRLARRRGRP